MSKSRGFTLVELLVTITIIAVLAAIGLVAYSMALKQGRDSKRQTDLRAIQSALEQYNSDQLFYPYTGTANGLDTLLAASPPPTFTSSIGQPSPFPSPVKTYMNSLPQDPTGTARYKYVAKPDTPACDNSTATTKCTSYCLYANLENLSSPDLNGCPASGSYNFAVTLP